MVGFEHFSVYGFCTAYPKSHTVKLDPKSRREEGNIVFQSTDDGNIIVSWTPLSMAEERYSCLEEHVKDSVDRIRTRPRVKSVELVENRKMHVNSHEAVFSHIRMFFSLRRFWPFGKTFQEEIRSLHIYCRASGRYFVLYSMATPDQSAIQSRIFENIIESFVCHKKKTDSSGSSI